MLLCFTGMAFGTGSAVAHRAVDAVMGPRTVQHETVASQAPAAAAPTTSGAGSDACSVHTKAFQDVSVHLTTIICKLEVILSVFKSVCCVLFSRENPDDTVVCGSTCSALIAPEVT